ncbi:DUF2997 domain-containing protein [Sellimonas intestinalis]|uniref:DUF2997 domain-containing protein n=1 Tax=Sellimonas intestinalis TaxID=1653434 RepID=UPI0015EB61BB|nr:DUF2997 domain-containing protein [Sellimonas intestinalis]MBA2214184.1 DUF2997 domain-containing protein [Sellimonas intestinalis]
MSYIKIRICPDGLIYAETKGIKGKKCSDYEKVIEQLTGAKVIEKEFTEEFYQEEYAEEILEERIN